MSEGLVAGRFRIRALLGSGGTAAVFAAEDATTGRTVALKLLHRHLAADRAAWDAFFEEVRAAQSIDHPGIAEIYDAGAEVSDPPVVWIAMELVDGVTVAEAVRTSGPLPADAAIVLANRLLSALAAAHAGGVVHRDVSPANVMLDLAAIRPVLDRDRLARSIRLLDFGLADVPGRATVGRDALLSSAASAGSAGVVASVAYASPEHLSAAPVTELSDIYQVGATIFFALTGRPPFGGPTASIAAGHLSAPPPVPSAWRRGIPRQLDRIVTTAMLKDAADRYPSATAMRVAVLRAGAAGSAEHAEPVGAAASPDEPTGVTRVYRTSVPGGATASATPAQLEAATDAVAVRSRGMGWQSWFGIAVISGVVVALASLPAALGTPTAGPSSASASASGTASPTATPTPSPAPTWAAVPDVTGRSLADARAMLKRVGLTLGATSTEDSALAPGTVLWSQPAAGARTHPGSAVAVAAASGRNVVPPVVGLDPTQAQRALEAAGFATAVAAGDPGLGIEGVVVRSSPAPGEIAQVGATIVVTVPTRPASSPPPTPTPSPRPTPTPTTTGTPAP